ncbi:MAG: alpha/beta hydrolase [Maricaulaceae bacterium]|nr:alpha/beta hydrolase [Maricaulaceae bacterium]
MTDSATRAETVTIAARDGYPLSGLVIAPDRPKAAVLISSGTGFPKEFYRRIAEAGAARGYACLLYDYRGVAASAPASLRGFRADLMDWGRKDLPAALDAAAALAKDRPLFTLGHSAGGHLIGFAANNDRAAGHAFVNVGSGYWGRHFLAYRPLVLAFWLAGGPASLALKGYVSGRVWGGTDLPKGVFTQWRRWCFRPGYYGDELDDLRPHWFAEVTAPIRVFGATDDPVANPAASADVLKLYPNAPKDEVWLRPEDLGQTAIGHQGLFARAGARFWPMPFDWFDGLMTRA